VSFPVGARIGGIDAPLPPGEAVRWEGRPAWRPLVWRAFHGRTVLLYFGLLAIWQLGAAALGAKSWATAVGAVVFLMLLAAISFACSALLAWLSVRSTVYAITDRRVVLKVGIVIPSVISIPFRLVEAVTARRAASGSGDLAVRLAGTDRIAWMQLWPHVRPWRFARPEPALRGLPDVSKVGSILQQALADANQAGTMGPPAAAQSPNAAAARRPLPTGGAVTAGLGVSP
jgi:hypothetical protein